MVSVTVDKSCRFSQSLFINITLHIQLYTMSDNRHLFSTCTTRTERLYILVCIVTMYTYKGHESGRMPESEEFEMSSCEHVSVDVCGVESGVLYPSSSPSLPSSSSLCPSSGSAVFVMYG